MAFVLKPEIAIGDLVTGASVTVSALALLVAWLRDQQLRRKEYADRIRHSAGTVASKLDRWQELSLCFFDEIQPLITESDLKLTTGQNAIATRDFLWHGLTSIHSETKKRRLDEQVEIAYVDLYGYDSRIQVLFTETVRRMKEVDTLLFQQLLHSTQRDVLSFESPAPNFLSAQLGNLLRSTCAQAAKRCEEHLCSVMSPFKTEILKLMHASDRSVVSKRVNIRTDSALSKREWARWVQELTASPKNTDMASVERKSTALLRKTLDAEPLDRCIQEEYLHPLACRSYGEEHVRPVACRSFRASELLCCNPAFSQASPAVWRVYPQPRIGPSITTRMTTLRFSSMVLGTGRSYRSGSPAPLARKHNCKRARRSRNSASGSRNRLH